MSKGFNNFSSGSNPNQDSDPNTHSFRSSSDVRLDIKDVSDLIDQTKFVINHLREQMRVLESLSSLTEQQQHQYDSYAQAIQQGTASLNQLNYQKLLLKHELTNSLRNEKDVNDALKKFNEGQAKFKKLSNVFDSLEKKFHSTKVAKAFYNQYVDENGQISKAGQQKAEQLQSQDRFIRRLVTSLGTLPIFKTISNGVSQFGRILALKGISDFTHAQGIGGKAVGIGETIVGGLLTALPVLSNVFGLIVGNIISQRITEKLALLSIGGGKSGILGGITTWLASTWLGKNVSGFVKGSKTIGGLAGATLTGGKGQGLVLGGKVGQFIGKAGAVGLTYGAVSGAISSTSSFQQGDKLQGILQLLGSIGNMLTLFGGLPWVRVVGVILSVISMLGVWIRKKLNLDKPDMTQDATQQKMLEALRSRGTKTFGDGSLPLAKFGGRTLQSVTYSKRTASGVTAPMSLDRYSKSTLEEFGRQGQYNLETLKGGRNYSVDRNSFITDAMVLRKGSNAILDSVGKYMKSLGWSDMTITSGTRTNDPRSPHQPGAGGHASGQTIDIVSKNWKSEEDVDRYVSNLKSTGKFDSVIKEYKQGEGWHIDAHLTESAYKELQAQGNSSTPAVKHTNTAVTSQSKNPPGPTPSQIVTMSRFGVLYSANVGVSKE